MNDEKLSELATQFEQQNEDIAQLEAVLRTFGDVDISVPRAFLEELDELTAPRAATTPAMPVFGIRV